MTPLFANSAYVTVKERLVLRGGRKEKVALKVRWGILQHPQAGLVLIDTGYTQETVSGDHRSISLRVYAAALRPRLLAEGQPKVVLAAMGLRPSDVGTVIVTHFHPDHISGLRQFANARFIGCGKAFEYVSGRTLMQQRLHGVFSEFLPDDFQDRFDAVQARPAIEHMPNGLPRGHDLFGDGTVISVPLPGHAAGHIGLLFPKARRPLLYGVDVQWMLSGLERECAPGFPSSLIADNRADLAGSTDLVRQFVQQGGDVVLCHDPGRSPYDFDQ